MMMEGEPGTPVVARVPDEETAFIGRKVEAPKRRQRLQKQRSQRKRVAVVAVSTVTALAVGAVCVFWPSGAPDEVKTAVSQAMASASVKKVFVPSFSVYDEDGDGKVSLGEYLDRLTMNRDAALQRVEDSDLDETEKTRISDLLKEDFDKHSDCVTQIAQEHEDGFMTKKNFDNKYKKVMAFCPTEDDRIPDLYQVNEVAEGHEELVDEEASSAKNEWNPEEPTAPPRPATDSNDAKSEHGSKVSDEKPWSPDYPTSPPTPPRTDQKTEKWSPKDPPNPPRVATHNEESASSPKDPKETGVGDDDWNPTFPTQPEQVTSEESPREKKDSMKTGIGDVDWNPIIPTLPPDPAHTGIGDGDWNPTEPTQPSRQSARTAATPDKLVSNEEGGTEGVGQESPYGEQKNPEGEQPNGAFNAFTSGETGTYGENPRSEGVGQESPYGEQKNPEGEQPNGAFNAFTSGETGTYGENPRSEGAGQESPYGEQKNPEGEQPNGAFNEYAGFRENGPDELSQPRSENELKIEGGSPGGTAQDSDNPWRKLRGLMY